MSDTHPAKLTDNFMGRACKFVRGWLQEAHAQAILARPYSMENVATKRKLWREYGGVNYQETRAADGKIILKPFLHEPKIYGALDKDTRDQFLHHIEMAKRFLPNFLHILLSECGVEIKVAKILSDINENYRTMRMRGQDGVMDNTHGCYEPNNAAICVTQGYISRSEKKEKYTPVNPLTVVSTVLHEFGHAIEYIVFPMYRNGSCDSKNDIHYRDFLEAHRKDVAQLNGITTTVLGTSIKYYLQKEHGGTHESEEYAVSELFAELFSEKYMDCLVELQDAFPESTKIFDKMMNSLRLLVEKSPDFGTVYRAQNELPTLTSVVEMACAQK